MSKNGNATKGNAQKKKGGGFGKKEIFSDFDPVTDYYAKIINMEGGKGVSVMPLKSIDQKPVHVNIRGIHHKKVWYRKDDLVVIRGIEIWGKVNESEHNLVKRGFDKLEGKGDGSNVIFENEEEDIDDMDDADIIDKDMDKDKVNKKNTNVKPTAAATAAATISFGISATKKTEEDDDDIDIDAI
jgi:hypothetical protein